MNTFQVNLFKVWPIQGKEYHFKNSIKSFDKDCQIVWDNDHFNLRTKLNMTEARLSTVDRIEFISFNREYPEGVIDTNPCCEIFLKDCTMSSDINKDTDQIISIKDCTADAKAYGKISPNPLTIRIEELDNDRWIARAITPTSFIEDLRRGMDMIEGKGSNDKIPLFCHQIPRVKFLTPGLFADGIKAIKPGQSLR